jgi:hypothetical protein
MRKNGLRRERKILVLLPRKNRRSA